MEFATGDTVAEINFKDNKIDLSASSDSIIKLESGISPDRIDIPEWFPKNFIPRGSAPIIPCGLWPFVCCADTASAGALLRALSAVTTYQITSSSSTSKMRVEYGGMVA